MIHRRNFKINVKKEREYSHEDSMRPLQYGYGACWSIWGWVVQDLLCVQIYERMFSRHESRWAKYFNCKSWGSTWLQGFSRCRIWSWRLPRNAYPECETYVNWKTNACEGLLIWACVEASQQRHVRACCVDVRFASY